jgi:membrane-bound serine protease (ClpP class)
MDAFVLLALIGVALLIGEMLLPTGGVLATLGAAGLIAGGIVALTADSDSTAADLVGPALITLGILSFVSVYFVTRKVVAAHRDEPVRTGSEEMVGTSVEVRSSLDPEGQVWAGGALWRARLADGGGSVHPGDRVVIEAVDGLTLVVKPEVPEKAEKGAG